MKQTKYLIIGGGIAGTNAAESIRQKDLEGTITLVTEEKERLYSRVLLPQYLRDTVPLERVFLKKPDFYSQHSIDFLPETKVTSLDDKAFVVETTAGEIQFEKLLLACGSKLMRWEVPGNDLPGVVYLRTIEDAVSIKEQMETASEAVVVGGGFIALELLSSFVKKGISTTLLVREPHFFVRFLESAGGKLVEDVIKNQGVEVILEDEVAQVLGNGRVEKVITKKGKEITASLVGVGIGIAPRLTFLDTTQIVRSPYIETNEYLETSIPNIWAAGDVTFFEDILSGHHHNLGNWANAAEQGRIAGHNMTGGKEALVTSGAYSINFFGMSLAVLGDPNKNYATEVITRGSVEGKALGDLYFKEDVLIGATLVNLTSDRGAIDNLIKNQIRIKEKERLKDLNFSLGGLLNV